MFRRLKGVTLRKKDVDLQTANGNALKVLGVADIDFRLGDKDFRRSFCGGFKFEPECYFRK